MTGILKPILTWRSALAESRLDSTTKLVAWGLSLHMNERGGSCFPSTVTLARECSLSRSTVIKHLQVLQDDGWLSVDRSKGRRSNVYSATTPTVREVDGWAECPSDANRAPDDANRPGGEHSTVREPDTSMSIEVFKEGNDAPDGASAPPPDLDGMPLQPTEGHTFAETLAAWAGETHDLPPANLREESYQALVRHVDMHVPKTHRARHGVMMGLLGDYVADVTREPMHAEARSHMARMVSEAGPRWTLWALSKAVTAGAGIGEQYKSDSRALTKYAMAVLRSERAAS